MTERVLIVRLAALGDIVMVSPLLARIHAELPNAHVTWLCGSAMKPLVDLFDHVDRVVVVDERRLLRGHIFARVSELLSIWRALGIASFDRVLIAHGDGRYRALVPTLASGRVRMLEREISSRMNPVAGRYLGDEYARLLDSPENRGPITTRFPPADVRPRLEHAPPRRDPMVILVPGGARNVLRESPHRRWPVESYRRLADALLARGFVVVLVGDGNDAWVRPYFEGAVVEDRIGSASIVDTLLLMRDAQLVISHDTGPMHLARLVRTPLLALFGPTMPSQFLPGDDEVITVLWGGAGLPCRPCYDGREFARCADNVCMKSISVSEVVNAAERILLPPVTARSVHRFDP